MQHGDLVEYNGVAHKVIREYRGSNYDEDVVDIKSLTDDNTIYGLTHIFFNKLGTIDVMRLICTKTET